ncbi:Uncharacterised protein [Mycobacteroides abscessus subsp. abscessus]|nr:Uncharacterised protein [Mycobacteroides abscessus subsp. abscessus]
MTAPYLRFPHTVDRPSMRGRRATSARNEAVSVTTRVAVSRGGKALGASSRTSMTRVSSPLRPLAVTR